MQTEKMMSFSQQLVALAQEGSSERVSLGDLLRGIKTHALASLLILFSVPNLLPGIPGTSAVTGLPLVILTFQLMMGRPPWLPGFILNRSLRRSDLQAVMAKVEPPLRRLERVLRPRLSLFLSASAQRLIGAFMVLLSTLIMLPIPFANIVPALAIILMALGFLENDGLFILIGLVIGVLSILLVVVVYWAVIASVIYLALSTTA
jgi:hypothetical protein